MQNLGKFKLKSNELRVTDPCYEKNVWCSYVIPDALSGNWNAVVKINDEGIWGKRVSELIVFHENHKSNDDSDYEWVVDADIGVDSGQAGFFDNSQYPDGKRDYQDENSFYSKICKLTYHPNVGGTMSFGCVSSSGFGDGSYKLFVKKHDNKVVSAKIVFIPDEEEEDDYYDDDDD